VKCYAECNCKKSPLYIACYYGHVDIVKELLVHPGVIINNNVLEGYNLEVLRKQEIEKRKGVQQ